MFKALEKIGADSGTTLDAQARYAAGVKEILRRTFDGEELNPTDVIVKVCSSPPSPGQVKTFLLSLYTGI